MVRLISEKKLIEKLVTAKMSIYNFSVLSTIIKRNNSKNKGFLSFRKGDRPSRRSHERPHQNEDRRLF